MQRVRVGVLAALVLVLSQLGSTAAQALVDRCDAMIGVPCLSFPPVVYSLRPESDYYDPPYWCDAPFPDDNVCWITRCYYEVLCGLEPPPGEPSQYACYVDLQGCPFVPISICLDGVDNDGDTLIDYGSDPGCNHPLDETEMLDCSDGVDNDRDGSIDASDPGCIDASDPSERHHSLPCDDGHDNDLDQRVDFLPSGAPPLVNYGDPGCLSPFSPSERPQCQDGVDNDGDGVIDFDGGDSLDIAPRDGLIDLFFDLTTAPVGAPDPQCSGAPSRNSEAVDAVPGPSGAGRLGLFGILLASGIAAASAARRRVRANRSG